MRRRIAVIALAAAALIGAGAAAAHASTPDTLYRGAAVTSTLYRG
jgi:hypothetical protein